MLRAVTRLQISELVEESYFGLENYVLQFGDGVTDVAFNIKFLPDTRFEFVAERINGNIFQTTESPGERFLAADEIRLEGFDNVTGRLRRWLERVKQEVFASNPFSREVLELRTQLDERLASLGEELTGFFTKSEAADLVERLATFEARLRSLSDQNADLHQAVETLSRVLSDLNEAAQSVNRGTWYRMAGGRLLGGLKALSKSKEAREFALEAAKKFLLEGPK
jgi:hypothetical protein